MAGASQTTRNHPTALAGEAPGSKGLPPPVRRVTTAAWPDGRPRLMVIVDTEEEFDWSGPYSRANTRVSAMRHIHRAQRIFDRFGVRPVYVVDYPVAAQTEGYEPLQETASEGRCEIGAHLHPWVNPPYEEHLSVSNSFMMNLPETLQRSKLEMLTRQIATVFGSTARTFKAGRYGLGRATVPLLQALGFETDNSVCPRFDFSSSDGPSYVDFDSQPYYLTRSLLEVPCTVDYVGWAGPLRQRLHQLASREALQALRGVGVLARSGAVNRIMLSPEGNTFEEMRLLTEWLYRRGHRAFVMSFHSPSVAAGHTPYVRSDADVQQFLRTIEQFCEYFFGERQGVAAVPADLRGVVPPNAESE